MNYTSREVRNCDFRPPFYYGYSYKRFDTMIEVWHIIPLNYFIRLGRNISYIWDVIRGNPSWLDSQIQLTESRTRQQVLCQLDKHIEKALGKIIKEAIERKEKI